MTRDDYRLRSHIQGGCLWGECKCGRGAHDIALLPLRHLRSPPLTHSARLDRSTPARLRLVLLALPALKPTTPSGCSTAASTAPSRARTRSYIP